MTLPDPYPVRTLTGPLDASVRVPGSKSITNRALVAAALAEGTSRLRGALRADDTLAMASVLGALGARVDPRWDDDPARSEVEVEGTAGRLVAGPRRLDCRLSGTTSRFAMGVAALGPGAYEIDGAPGLRARPMADGIEALEALGATVEAVGEPGHLPVRISGGPVAGGAVVVAGATSSQFLSGLLLAAPCTREGVELRVEGPLVSRSYVELTVAVMQHFGASVTAPPDGGRSWEVAPSGYRAGDLTIEPDASAASYFFAAAAICGGSVTVEGLGAASRQGDLRFVELLGRMGAEVHVGPGRTTVTGTGRLSGIEADMGEVSDTAQTLAAVAAFADGPTRITGIGFIRAKETDRVGHVVRELRRCGVDAEEEADGYVVRPAPPRPAIVQTYGDHRMAMAFALLGLAAPGIRIADPGCVAKTFPGYWTALEALGA